MQFTVRCHSWLADALASRVAAEKDAEVLWWEAQRAMVSEDASPAEQTAMLEQLQAEFERLRAADQMLGTRSALLIPAVRDELRDRGWLDRRWKPLPPGVRSRRGRRVGATDRGFDARFVVNLPDQLGTRVVCATYWSSVKSVEQLQAWRARFGDGPREGRSNGRRWTGAGPSNADLQRKSELLAGITHPPDVLRAAAQRVVAAVSTEGGTA
jgi:hypothetical protein